MIDSFIRERLKAAYGNNNITLFLGAGVSAGSGLPNWRELVTSMYFRYMKDEDWRRMRPFPNYLYAASKWYMNKLGESLDIVVRKLKTGWTEEEFQRSLWESLYGSRIGPNEFILTDSNNRLLQRLVGLVQETSAIRRVRSVITYNFDDLFEQAIRAGGGRATTIYDNAARVDNGVLPIYHVHGFVPYCDNPGRRAFGRIVLTEDDYHDLSNDANCWNNLVQITALTANTTIMIGLSLADRNLRRILKITAGFPNASENYVFLQRPKPIQLTPGDIEMIDFEAGRIAEQWNSERFVKERDRLAHEVKAILNTIMQNYSGTEDRVLESMGITPIWFDEHEDVLDCLQII